MKITEIILEFQLQKNQWELDISNDAKHEVSDDLINLVQTAYAGTAQGSFVNNVSNLLPSDWAVLDFDADPDVDSAVFYRGPRANEPWTGFKIQGLGHDGSRISKDRALDKLAEMLNKPGWWIESSGALRSVLARRGCPIVTNQRILQGLFPNTGLEMIDDSTYSRHLPEGGTVTETVFGNPRLNQSGPLEEETLDELVGIKNQTRDLPRNPARVAEFPLGTEWHKVLYNNGFRALGSGSFGTVWEHPKLSYVLKVFTADDIAYADWMATARQHKSNPHMPKFLSPKPFTIVPGVMAVRMERLTRIDENTYKMLNMINIVVNEAIISRQSASALIASSVEYRRHNGFMTYCQNYPEFVPALDILVKFVMRPGFRPDIHDDNLMMRGPVIVLTDPVFDKKALQAHGR
jgi:hypothetical protein